MATTRAAPLKLWKRLTPIPGGGSGEPPLPAARLHGGDFGQIGREIVGGEGFDIHFDQAHERTTKIRFGCAAAIDNHADSGDDTTVGVDDVDCFLHAAAARDDVFDNNESLVRRNLKAAAENQFAFVFLYKMWRLPNERPTSWPTIIPPRAGEITVSQSNWRILSASHPQTVAAISAC